MALESSAAAHAANPRAADWNTFQRLRMYLQVPPPNRDEAHLIATYAQQELGALNDVLSNQWKINV